jgi:hypothetical protein
MVPKFQVAAVCFLYSSHFLGSSKLNRHAIKATKLFPQILQFSSNGKVKIPRPLPRSTFIHSKVLAFLLLLSKGRAGEASEHSNTMTLFLPSPNKVSFNCLMTLFSPSVYYSFVLLSASLQVFLTEN